MKKTFLFFLVIVAFSARINAQPEQGEPILRVYSNFYKGLSKSDPGTAFEVRRVYLGYKGKINENFSTEVKLDIGSPEDLSQYSLIRRYAYFKTAALKYQKDRLTIHAGLFDMLQYDIQESIWGYRYLYKSFMDEQKFGPSADIGFGMEYEVNDFIQTDLIFSNGEGYKNLQTDDAFKTGIGLTLHPLQQITLRLYYDFIHKEQYQTTLATFLSYNADKYRISIEYNKMWNNSFVMNHNLIGTSFYGTYIINEQWEVFARYDRLVSNLDPNAEIPWNLNSDGSAIISGIQYKFDKNIKLALNYRDWYSYAGNGTDKSYLFLNLEFRL